MPRFVVERTFPAGLAAPMTDDGADARRRIIAINANLGVTWVTSYVSGDQGKTYCIYDAPSSDAIRHAAIRLGLPVDGIMQVSVLDPCVCH